MAEPLKTTGLEGYAGIPADLEAGILEDRKVTNRATRQAGERAEEMEKEAARMAQEKILAQDKVRLAPCSLLLVACHSPCALLLAPCCVPLNSA